MRVGVSHLAGATVGAILWVSILLASWRERAPLGILEILFLLAPLVLVPLALNLVGAPAVLRVGQPMAATSAAVSFLVPHGLAAGALTLPWLAVTGLVALDGFARLRSRRLRLDSELAIDAGRLLLPVGAGWLALSRLGVTPLGFEEPIVLLTAVHFHYAAFLAPVLVGLAGRAFGDTPAHRVAIVGAIAAPPLIAAGITLSPPLEWAGVLAQAASLSVVAVRTLRHVHARVTSRVARLLLTTSSLALLVAMALAPLYAWGSVADQGVMSLATMARVHGPLNAFGFALCGLLGWTLVEKR